MNLPALRATLQTLVVTPHGLPQPKTLIVDTLPKDAPERLQGAAWGVVFTPRAMLEAMDLAAQEMRKSLLATSSFRSR